ncbi:DegT/DnrJ/EryC1/StrS family aminotransferase [Bradyrhizobium ottawaense]|uniref:DegT/DnrJ/EryC1/StrS family aminotransferase n=1 Tax=Bradyrhizobium ottawaense TaxID=931866 RepID=UPI0003FE6943|nr:DegT/DnrJ/EryC1/StrS family aminotransferase [Bradyrhizobium ottawaense]
MKKIPFFDYPALFRLYEAEFIEAFKNAGTRGAFIMQKDLEDFETTLAGYTGAKHAIGVADGTMALLIGLRSAGIGASDEVLVPSHTFVASAAAVRHAGATPVLVDCGEDHLMDAASAAKAITSRTRAIMPVQLNGRVANMDALCMLASEHGLKVIEDSCQALGAKFRERQAGRFGAAGAFSFYPSKTLGSFGDGGAIITDDDTIAENARMLRDHGRGKSGKVEAWGYNSRLDNIQAAILNVKFRYYDKEVARRRSIARQYHERLKDIKELRLPPPPDSDPDHYDIYQNYEIEAEDRNGLKAHLQDRGIGTIIQWGGYTIHQFEKLGLGGNVPYTERMTQRYLLLPMNVSVDDAAVAYIGDAIAEFYHRGNA